MCQNGSQSLYQRAPCAHSYVLPPLIEARLAKKSDVLEFINSFDTPGASPDEQELVSIARRWLTLFDNSEAPFPTRLGEARRLRDEFDNPKTKHVGSAWNDLRMRFEYWARSQGLGL